MDIPFLSYIPHGVNLNDFHRVEEKNELEELNIFKNKIFKNKSYDFVILFNSRNIRRKNIGNLILAYNDFCSKLSVEESKKCVLILHTQIVDPNGTDLFELKRAVCNDYNVIFSESKLNEKELNFLYNASDVTVNVSYAEGFGLSTAESLMAETMIISNTTGGLQDQIGFVDKNNKSIEFTEEWPSNHDGKETRHGKWSVPIFPKVHSLVGSPPTPYIYDDHVATEDIENALNSVYSLSKETRREYGNAGRRFMLSDSKLNSYSMCNSMIHDIEYVLNNWTPINKYEILTFNKAQGQ